MTTTIPTTVPTATVPDITQTTRVVAEVVGLDIVSPEANFFDLGGDSLTAAHLSLLLEERFDGTVDVFTIYSADDITEIHDALVQSLTTTDGIAA